jgi:hypothetical protein
MALLAKMNLQGRKQTGDRLHAHLYHRAEDCWDRQANGLQCADAAPVILRS